MSGVVVEAIESRETHPLRQHLLRPHQPLEAMAFAGDDDRDTRHFGARDADGQLLGIVSIYRQPYPQAQHFTAPGDNQWQLRAMATDTSQRKLGLGRKLLAAAEEYAQTQSGGEPLLIWANAREIALGFYRACGYQTRGELFYVAEIGPHQLIEKLIN